VLWLDNCSSQNNNWALLSFLVFIIHSSEITTKVIDLFFSEPGHTFMSADNFHHQVEKALKKQKKLMTSKILLMLFWTDNKYPKTTNKILTM